MTFKQFFGLGVGIIIYGLCAVGWADVKPVNPKTMCQQYLTPTESIKLKTYLLNYKTYGTLLLDGRYLLCIDQVGEPEALASSLVIQPVSGDKVVVYGLQAKLRIGSLGNFPFISVFGDSVLLQNLQLTGPGSNISGSIGVSLNGSNLSIINSAITGFETGVKADCVSPSPQPPPIEGGGDSSPPAQNDKASCTIGPNNVIEDVALGVVLPATSQGVTITQNEIRTIFDLDSTTQKIFLKSGANGGLTPPTFSIDSATMTIWKTLSEDALFVTKIGGVLPNNGTIELFEHREETQIGGSKTHKDYFRASCPSIQNDKGLFEFNCTGLNINAKVGIVFVDVTYTPNTSAMTKWIDVKNIPEYKKTAAVNPGGTISGGSLTGDSSPPEADPPLAEAWAQNDTVGGAGGETLAMLDGGGLGGTAPSPQPSPTGGEGELIVDEAQKESSSAAAMTGGAVSIGGDATPSAVGASAGCGSTLMVADPLILTLSHMGRGEFYGVILWWLMPVVGLWYARKRQ